MKGFSIQKQFRIKRRTSLEPAKPRQKYADMATNIIRISDIVLEILDARFIRETRNHEIEKLIHNLGKKMIFVLNKSDLVDIGKLRQNLPEDMHPYVFISCKSRSGIKELRDRIKSEIKRTDDNYKRKHVGIIGYPNTGKSSLINFIVGKKVARTSSEAGFTKGIQRLKLAKDILLIDTPGIIPDKEFHYEKLMKTGKYAIIGARTGHQIKDPEIDVYNLMQKYPGVIERFYGLTEGMDFQDFTEQLGRRKNFIARGNKVDETRTFRMILKDWQEGKIRI